MSNDRPCIFGEVLFDHFPDGTRVLGGAPFNVAWHLQAFGLSPRFVSRVGDDPQGQAIRNAMRDWGMDTATLQTDPALPTGRVDVSFADGEPHYDIVRPCAYDAIQGTALPDGCDFLYHGSLALREPASRAALRHLADRCPDTVFVDVNLRPPWWDARTVQAMLHRADWVKLNADELRQLHDAPRDAASARVHFIETYDLRGLILTHGSQGAEVLTPDGSCLRVAPKRDIDIVDTVGAGDAFASVMILGLVRQWPLAQTLQRAQHFASRLVGNRGATVSDRAFYQAFIDLWQTTDQ